MRKINWLEILFWIILAVLIIMILTRIFGGSATDVQIYIAITTGMLTIMSYIVKMNREIGEIKIEMKHISSGIKQGFIKIREDINKLQNTK